MHVMKEMSTLDTSLDGEREGFAGYLIGVLFLPLIDSINRPLGRSSGSVSD